MNSPTPAPAGPVAEGFPSDAVRDRARRGTAAVFPPLDAYGSTLFGADPARPALWADPLDAFRLVPPVFMPQRLEKLVDLAREPVHHDVELTSAFGGFASAAPVYLSAFGSTRIAGGDLGLAASRQAGRLGIPMVVGENIVPVEGYGRSDGTGGEDGEKAERMLLARLHAYLGGVPDGVGGVVVQQSTEDADAEVWNLVHSDPGAAPLLDTGRLAFELKVGQGAKPGLGGMTVLPHAQAARVSGQYTVDGSLDAGGERLLRCSSPGTFTDEILRQQIRLMRNNFPRVKVWVKLPPGRDVGAAARVAWESGADAVTVDGAEGGSGWAPTAFLDHVGLPLGECLRRVGRPEHDLLASGRMWEGTRAVKALALGARAVGLGRAALVAVAEDPENGLVRLVEALALELRLLVSAVGKYRVGDLGPEDLWSPGGDGVPVEAPTALVPGGAP
ncbi:glutamate synthase [Streptomyces sp. RKND-216]|uniref:glutamate synthase-related protein n=1 Tax=Streptomyces sp. RKND-216 TaxID=2562581 RepID=UPI00109DD716|nr:glutamate synthase-related protein [Streptomyces sp. RKND-216]THA23952.1 glutamate synthase [Streptomyces sp. RKND-216]